MGRWAAGAVMVVFGAVLALAPAAVAPAAPQPLADVQSFALALGNGTLRGDMATRYAAYDLIVVDGEEATAEQVAQLRAGGSKVLAYLSIGSIERWRPWAPKAIPYRMEPVAGWTGERYADTSKAGFRDLIVKEVAPAILGKGFDGLFLDNVDMIETHRRQRAGMFSLVRRLSALTHAQPGRAVMAQNGAGAITPIVGQLDAWNREDVTATWDGMGYRSVPAGASREAQAELRIMRRRGLLVTATDYTGADGTAVARRAVARACAAGALPFVSDIGLTRIPAQPLRCG
ncbi:endo alpha-1,4 polygalactosaminidase [Svornostia abyssi]|uniref:Endo alpha-1,4 polygalactosaminidase n=1 Tax=Svornostia abyssi TaxID=2898438 RepID=A0ABY5PEA2_9ACTN|nr:endo alpha-1,4 polygalactosaminidase [Parviterribacteraceae bacterium J379]